MCCNVNNAPAQKGLSGVHGWRHAMQAKTMTSAKANGPFNKLQTEAHVREKLSCHQDGIGGKKVKQSKTKNKI